MTNEEAVERFAAHWRDQVTPTWTPVTPYDQASRRKAEGRHPEVIRDTFAPTSVLDVGCGPDGHLVTFLREIGVDARGWDIVTTNADYCVGDRDLTSPYLVQRHERDANELVICREVLEHLPVRHMPTAIRNLVALTSRYVYVTTRFAVNPDHFLSLQTEFDVDPTHITCLTKPFLALLFTLEGCRRRPDLEVQVDWLQKGRCLVFER